MQGSTVQFAIKDKTTLATILSRAKVEQVIPPVANGSRRTNTQQIMLPRPDSPLSPVPNARKSSRMSEIWAVTGRRSIMPSQTTRTGRRQDAQLLCENTAALVLRTVSSIHYLSTGGHSLVPVLGFAPSWMSEDFPFVKILLLRQRDTPYSLFDFLIVPPDFTYAAMWHLYFPTVPHALLTLDWRFLNSCCTLPRTFVFNAGCLGGTLSLVSY